MSRTNEKHRAISGIFWKLLERGGYSFVQMLIQVVLARLLSPDDFGSLAIMLVFVNIGNVFVESGLNTALIQSPDECEDDCSTVFTMSFLMAAVLYFIVFFSAPYIAAFYSMESIVWPLRVLALVLFLNAINSVQVAKVTRSLQMRKTFVATICSVVISGGIGIALALAGSGIWALVGQQLTYQLVNCCVLLWVVDWKPSFKFNPGRAKSFFSFGSKLLVSGVLNQGYQSLSDLVIGAQFSPSQLGLVSQGKKYPAAVGSMLDGAIQPVMLSSVSRAQGGVPRVKRIVRRALKTSTFLIVPAMTLFACCAPTLVPLLLGPKWAPAIPFMQIYCFVYALLPIHTTNLQALNGMGRSDLFLKLELAKKGYGAISLLFCAFVLNDVTLLVASYLVTGILSTFINAWPNRRVIDYSYREQIGDIAPAFILSCIAACMSMCVGYFLAPTAVTLLVQILVFAFVYIGLSIALKMEAMTYILNIAREFLSGRNS